MASFIKKRLTRARELAEFFYAQRITGFGPPGEPWLDEDTKARFSQEIGQAKLYLEYGSGGTTVLADKLGVPTISIESDRFYARTVRRSLKSGKTINMITPDIGVTKEWGYPLVGAGRKGGRYVDAPYAHLNGRFPDLILVDGRYRAACALEAARRAQVAGATPLLIFDDYIGRDAYHVVETYLGKPEIVGRSAIFRVGSRPIPRSTVEKYFSAVL